MRLRPWITALALACRQQPDHHPADADADADVDADTDTDTDPPPGDTGSAVAACADIRFTTVPVDWTTTTAGATDDWTPPDGCAWPFQSGTEDVTAEFVAPTRGRYAFSTAGSTVQVLLSVADTCGGAVTDCTDGVYEASLTKALQAGEHVFVIADTRNVAGEVSLHITSIDTEADCADGVDDDYDGDPDCADSDCAAAGNCAPACPDATMSAPGVFTGFTGGLPDEVEGSCNPLPHQMHRSDPELGVAFTAPTAGRYLARTTSSVLFATDGCGGAELGCGNTIYDSERSHDELADGLALAFDLAAGESIVVYSETYYGVPTDFDLTITEVPATETSCGDGLDEDFDRLLDCGDPDCATEPGCQQACPDHVASGPLPIVVRGTTTGAADEAAPSCAYASGIPDETIAFEAQTAGRYAFTLESSDVWLYDSVVLSLSSSCGEPEDACTSQLGTREAWSALGEETYGLIADLAAGESVVVTYQPRTLESGDYSIVIEEVPASEADCADGLDEDHDYVADCFDPDCATVESCLAGCSPAPLAGAPPLVVAGDTFGRAAPLASVCGTGSSQAEYTFVASATTTYGFGVDAPGAVTVSVHESCDGAELTCAYVSQQSGFAPGGASLAMTAGQTVVVAVASMNVPATPFDLLVFEQGSEVCGDRADNDLDGRPDCWDPECQAVCAETCGNGLDDDQDGLADCLDPECAGDASCVDACPEATLDPQQGWLVMDAVGRADDFRGSCGPPWATSDVTASFTAPADGTYHFGVGNGAVSVRSDCAGAELACGERAVDVDLQGGETVIVVYELDPIELSPSVLWVE